MEIQVKNADLAMMLGQLTSLESERMTLGTKSRVQKIIKALEVEYKHYNKLHIKLLIEHNGSEKPNGIFSLDQVPTESFKSELKEILEQKNTILIDQIDFEKLSEIETEKVYNFELLSVFFENYN